MSPLIKGINDKHLADKKFGQLNDNQLNKLIDQYGSRKAAKSAYKEARTRFAGEEVADNPAAVTLIDEAAANIDNDPNYFPDGAPILDPKTDNIYKYDTKSFGAGSKKGTQRLSADDLRNLRNQGFALEDIVEYSENITASGDVLQGGKAESVLNKFRSQIEKDREPEVTIPEPVDPEPESPPGPTEPEPETPAPPIIDPPAPPEPETGPGPGPGTGPEPGVTPEPGPVQPDPEPDLTTTPGFNIDAGFEVGGDLINRIGDSGDTRIDVSGSEFGDNALIGNDESTREGTIDNGSKIDITYPEKISVVPGNTSGSDETPLDYYSRGLGGFIADSPFSVGGDLKNQIGDSGDTTISAVGATFGDGAQIGIDKSTRSGTIRNGNSLTLDPQAYLASFLQ